MVYQNAVKIIYTEGQVENVEALLAKQPMQIGLSERNVCTIKGKACVILDFGKELSGGARVLTHQVAGSKAVRIRFGESVSETCSELTGSSSTPGATNDHSTRDMRVDLQSYSDMTFGQTGFRFVRIDTLSDDSVMRIKSVLAAVDTDTRPALGSFECDDPLVNTIWDTAAYTVRLCIQNGYIWDGIKRDRLVWLGDLYPEVRAAQCIFGDLPEGRNCLDFSMDETPLPNPINGIPTYSLWWVISLGEVYRFSEDKPSFKAYVPYVKGIVESIVAPAVSADGKVDYGYNFIDWPSLYQEGETDTPKRDVERKAGVAYLTKLTLTAARNLLVEFSEDTSLCDKLLAAITANKYEINIYKQIAALGVLSGEGNDSMRATLLKNGAKGLSTFMAYPILTAVASFGEHAAALQMMKDYYGGMLSVGATSFWEDFDLEWLEGSGRLDEMPKEGLKDIHGDFGQFCYGGFRHSFCHGWSAGVIPYLVETVAGIKTMGAGMRRIAIQPQLSGLKHVKVNYPTPYGIMTVEHELMENGEVKTSVVAPKEIEIV